MGTNRAGRADVSLLLELQWGLEEKLKHLTSCPLANLKTWGRVGGTSQMDIDVTFILSCDGQLLVLHCRRICRTMTSALQFLQPFLYLGKFLFFKHSKMAPFWELGSERNIGPFLHLKYCLYDNDYNGIL